MGGREQGRVTRADRPSMICTWAIQGRNGRVELRIEPPAGAAGKDAKLMTAEFVAELSDPGYFRGTSTVRVLALDLVRFHRDLGGMVAGRSANATLGSL